jgi:TRAP-type C4-dicarboxylate transport system permease small subunit
MNSSQDRQPGGLEWVERNFTRIARYLAITAGIFALIITLISIKEIIFRNLFESPSNWGTEVEELLVLWIFLLPMAFTQMNGGMVRVTFVIEKLPRALYPWFKILASFSCLLFGSLFTYASYRFFSEVVPGSYFPETGFPAAIQRGFVFVSAILLTLAGLISTVRDILVFERNPSLQDGEAGGIN